MNFDCSFSIDKIKIKGLLSSKKYPWQKFIHIRMWCEFGLPKDVEIVKCYDNCLSPFKYKWCYTLRIKGEKEGSFTVFEHYNGDYREGAEKPRNFMIEYNPNKSGALIFEKFCDSFVFHITEIHSFDLAIDFLGYSTSDVVLDTKCDVMTYGKTYNKTLYISPKEEQSGRIKIYDKQKERASLGVDIEKTLRIEATFKKSIADSICISSNMRNGEELIRVCDRINSVKIKKENIKTKDWRLFALSHLTPEALNDCLSLMSENTGRKYKNEIIDLTYLSLGIDTTTLIIEITKLLKPWNDRRKIK